MTWLCQWMNCFSQNYPPHVRLEDLPCVKLDTVRMGQDVVIVKSGRRICGSGGALASCPIAQDKAYFEMKLQSTGSWAVGLGTKKVQLNTQKEIFSDSNSWLVRQDGTLVHNGEEKGALPEAIQEGDVLGMTYDHVELNFFLNGKSLNAPFTGMKGTLYPLFFVDDGAIMDVQFADFYHTPPDGFEQIMVEKQLL